MPFTENPLPRHLVDPAAPDFDPAPLADEAPAAVPIVLQTFGAARVQLGSQSLGMHNALLFLLVLRMAYTPGMAVRRDTLLQEFWPDQDDTRQRGNLRQALYKLRNLGVQTALRGDAVYLEPSQVERNFALTPSVESFERDITLGSEPYGAFLPGIAAPTPALRQWVERTREELYGVMRRVLVEVLRLRRERADWKGTQMVAEWLLQLDPLNEDGTLALAECSALLGSKAEAVAILDRYMLELGTGAGDIRLPATLLRRRFAETPTRRRSVALVTDKYMLGREQELSDLTMSLRRARWHDGSALLMHGPPGLGKSRLMAEVLKVAQLEGYRDVVMECRESISTRPLGALIEALPELLSAPGAMGCSPESLTILRKLLGPEVSKAETDEESPAPSEPASELTATERIELALRTMRAQSVRHAVVDLFAAVSDERPIFVLAEDVHWLDDASWEVLSDVMQRVNEMRVFIVLTSRFATIREQRPARVPTPLTYHRLAPLPVEALGELVRSAADDFGVGVTEEAERWIIGGCEGNPLMLRALLEHWAATGCANGVPPSLTTLIDQRIDRLDSHAQQALQAISLLGQFASLERIKLVLELPVHELIHALEMLEFSGCLSTSHAALVITHDLVRHVSIRRMSPLAQAALRASIGDTLEAEYLRTADLVILHESLLHTEQSGRPDVLYRVITTYDEALVEGGRPIGVTNAIQTLSVSIPEIRSERRFEILQSRLDTQSGFYRRAVRNFLGALRIPQEIENISVPEVEELIAIVDSAHRADPVIDRNHLAQFLILAVSHNSLPIPTRARAAETLLTIVANTCDGKSARVGYESISTVLTSGGNDDASLRLSILFHAIFGELTTARSAAKEVLRRCEKKPASTLVAGDIGRAAFALRLCGEMDASISAFKKHFSMAEELHSPRLGLFSAWQIAQIELELGNTESVLQWNSRLSKILTDDEDPISSSFVAAHFCRCAIEERDRARALQLLGVVKMNQPKLTPVKAAAYVLALELGCELLNPRWVPTDALLGVAREKHRLTAAFGTSDYFTAVLSSALNRAGRTTEARELINFYKQNARRERGPLSRALEAISKKVGAP